MYSCLLDTRFEYFSPRFFRVNVHSAKGLAILSALIFLLCLWQCSALKRPRCLTRQIVFGTHNEDTRNSEKTREDIYGLDRRAKRAWSKEPHKSTVFNCLVIIISCNDPTILNYYKIYIVWNIFYETLIWSNYKKLILFYSYIKRLL